MEWEGTMTWGETWRAIKGGDVGVAASVLVEIAIITSPISGFAIICLWLS